MKVMNDKENARRDAMNVEDVRVQYSDAELQAMGDRSPLYRYVV